MRSAGLPHYQAARDERAAAATRPTPPAEATTAALLAVVDAEQPPLRLLLSSHALTLATQAYRDRLAVWDEWADVARSADGS